MRPENNSPQVTALEQPLAPPHTILQELGVMMSEGVDTFPPISWFGCRNAFRWRFPSVNADFSQDLSSLEQERHGSETAFEAARLGSWRWAT